MKTAAKINPLSRLTRSELQALQFFAALHGSRWKAKLRHAWESGYYPIDFRERTISELQTIRNIHGPSFLGTFTTADLEAAK